MPKTKKVTDFQEPSPDTVSVPNDPPEFLLPPQSPFCSAVTPSSQLTCPFSDPQKVYHLLSQIPPGSITTYAHLARVLSTSPRAVGNALRNNPFAPEVPCHRVITASGFIGGFLGECNEAPSGVNQMRKRELLKEEGVEFDEGGMLIVKEGKKGLSEMWFDGPWDLSGRLVRVKVKTEIEGKTEGEDDGERKLG